MIVPGPDPGMLAVSTTELTIRMVVGLIVVGLLLALLTRVTRRVIEGRGGLRPAVTIRHQQRLDRNTSITLLRAGERNLLIGTSGQAIVLLAEGEDLIVPEAADPAGRVGTPSGSPAVDGGQGRGSGHGGGWGRPRPIRALQNMTVRRG